MRCSCTVCDTYMVHSESMTLGCVCPECGNRCTACLGTNTVISREALKKLADNPAFLSSLFQDPEEQEETVRPEKEKYERDEFVD